MKDIPFTIPGWCECILKHYPFHRHLTFFIFQLVEKPTPSTESTLDTPVVLGYSFETYQLGHTYALWSHWFSADWRIPLKEKTLVESRFFYSFTIDLGTAGVWCKSVKHIKEDLFQFTIRHPTDFGKALLVIECPESNFEIPLMPPEWSKPFQLHGGALRYLHEAPLFPNHPPESKTDPFPIYLDLSPFTPLLAPVAQIAPSKLDPGTCFKFTFTRDQYPFFLRPLLHAWGYRPTCYARKDLNRFLCTLQNFADIFTWTLPLEGEKGSMRSFWEVEVRTIEQSYRPVQYTLTPATVIAPGEEAEYLEIAIEKALKTTLSKTHLWKRSYDIQLLRKLLLPTHTETYTRQPTVRIHHFFGRTPEESDLPIVWNCHFQYVPPTSLCIYELLSYQQAEKPGDTQRLYSFTRGIADITA